ncbi:transposase [Pseudodesulfovibrio sp.]
MFDRFHVVKLMNEKITRPRRQLCRELTSPLERKAAKGTR